LQAVDTAGLGGLDVLDQEASVVVPTEETGTLELPGLTPTLPRLESDPQLEVRPTTVTVVLSGPASLVAAVNPEDLEVTIPPVRATLAPGEQATVNVIVEGLPEWVTYEAGWIVLLRPAGQ
jgi:hypothetical protein